MFGEVQPEMGDFQPNFTKKYLVDSSNGKKGYHWKKKMRLAFWYVLAMFHFPLFDNLELSKLFFGGAKSMLNIEAFWDMYMGVEPKIGGKPPKMDGVFSWKTLWTNGWFGGPTPLFGNTHIYIYTYTYTN